MLRNGGIMDRLDLAQLSSRLGLRKFYKNQLYKFNKLGIGNETENGVIITETLIYATERRLKQLTDREIGK